MFSPCIFSANTGVVKKNCGATAENKVRNFGHFSVLKSRFIGSEVEIKTLPF
jgi:hypothetical protein